MQLPPEEIARANVYGLLARLCQAPPDAALLEAIAGADEVDAESRAIVDPWIDLAFAAACTDAETVRAEYEHAFRTRRKARAALLRLAECCDTLRGRIAGGEFDLAQQERFFNRSLAPAARRFDESIRHAPGSRFYRHVGRFAAAFFRLERAAFQLFPTLDLHRSMNA